MKRFGWVTALVMMMVMDALGALQNYVSLDRYETLQPYLRDPRSNQKRVELGRSFSVDDYTAGSNILDIAIGFGWQPPVENATNNSAPAAAGTKRYIAAAGGTWTANSIYEYDTERATWFAQVPVEGCTVWNKATNTLYQFDGAAWAEFSATGTFTGGSITGDVTLANNVDIRGGSTLADTSTIGAYNTDVAAYRNVLGWVAGDPPTLTLGHASSILGIASTAFNVSAAGAVTAVGLTTSGAATSINANSNYATNINTGSSNAAVAIGGGFSTLAIDTSAWDITSAGAISGLTTLGLSGDLTSSAGDILLANGKGVKGSTTDAQTVGLYGYDVDGAAYVGALVITNGNTPAAVLGNANGTTAITSADWAIGTTGDITGVGAITMDGILTINNAAPVLYANEAITFTHATNGAGDDLTFSLTGANDASFLVTAAGTGADAIGLAASAGTVKISGDQLDIDTTNDFNLTVTSSVGGEDLLITQSGANDSSIILTADGTGTDAISLAAAAGTVKIAGDLIDMDSTGDFNLTVTSSVGGEDILITQAGANDSSITLSAAGTGADAIGLQASAGGVDIDAAAALDVAIDGGQVLITSKDNAASAIALTANVGADETIVVTNTQGTNAGAITLTATAGGITLNASSGITTGDAVTGDGTAALGGFLKTVTDDTNGKTLNVNESGTVQTNAGAGGAAAWTLPAAAAGLEYTFVVMAAQELRVTPGAGDVINIAGTAGDAAEYWTANAIGEALHLVAVDGTNWVAISSTGTWTQQTP